MNPIVQQFMQATYPQACSRSAQDEGAPQPPLELPVEGERTFIPLPPPGALQIPAVDLREAIERRRTLRRYSEQPLSIEELSYLLWLTQGVKEVTSRPATLRTVPSAGARHPFETYLLINAVKGLEPGLYRFAAGKHALARLVTSGCSADGGIRAEITRACGEQQQVTRSAATFIWVAVAERMTWRYVERGYRYLHLDAGHVCQNLYLAAEAIGCGVCAIAAYDDAQINAALDLDGQELFVIYLASLGKR